MNLILFSDKDRIDANTLLFKDHRHRHIKNILKPKAGDTLSVGEINGLIGQGKVEYINESEVRLTCHLSEQPTAPLPLTVVLALPRPKMLRRILKNIAELGVKRIALIHSNKVEKSYWQSPFVKADNINSYFLEGLSQSKDTRVPIITMHNRFRPFAEDVLPSLLTERQGFIAHPYSTQPMPAPSCKERVIIIGPEGGFDAFEVDLIKAQGVESISMGRRIYRVENAVTLLSAYLSFTA